MEETNTKEFLKSKKVLVLGGIIILIALFSFFLFKDRKYQNLETSMLATAKSLVANGKINFDSSYYLSLEDMEIKETYDCLKNSGVNITKVNNTLKYEPYLFCSHYQSKIVENFKSKYISLIGDNPLVVQLGSTFNDPGYNSNGYRVLKNSNYRDQIGIYKATYIVYDNNAKIEEVNRYIIVISASSKSAPTITLNGDEKMILKVGNSYVESGYTAFDEVDGVITSKVTRTGSVNTSVVGDYELTYRVTNSRGLTTIKKRTVVVVNKDINITATANISPEVPTKGSVIITISIIGSDYSYTVKPNHETTRERIFDYEVYDSGNYNFTIYDNKGNSYVKTVEVTNIDKEAPKGSCLATSAGGVVTYQVTASDNSGIRGYSYYTGTTYTEFMSSNTFTYAMDYNLAKVVIEDYAYNQTVVACETKKVAAITSLTVPDNITIYVGDVYTIPVTITPPTALKKELIYSVTSGANHLTLQDGVITATSAGSAIINIKVENSTLEKNINVTVKSRATIEWHPSSDNGETASWCTKKAGVLKGYLNGKEISDRASINMSVGETITLTMYLPKECGTIQLLTRTNYDGVTNWQNYFTQNAIPFVNRYDKSTFVATDHFDWVITANRTTRSMDLTLTTFQSTSKYEEIKSFYHLTITVK